MSFTYTGRPSDSLRDEVRFLIQDQNEEEHLIEDEEIAYLLDKFSNDINATCAEALRTMARRWAKKQELAVSNYRHNLDNVYKKLMDAAEEFTALASAYIYSAAISISEKEYHRENTDNVQPSFYRGLMEHPEGTTEEDEDAVLQ